MKEIYVNLKRFEVPRALGGLGPQADPVKWIEEVVVDTIEQGMGSNSGLSLVYLLPESLLPAAIAAKAKFPVEQAKMLGLGCQGVHWDNISPGGNFGAFTTALPATSAKVLGCTWAIIGHSEERRFKAQVMKTFEPEIENDFDKMKQAAGAVDHLIQSEVQRAFESGLDVLLCIGESAAERGDGSFEEQQPRIEAVLKEQLLVNLDGVKEFLSDRKIVIGYEPIWAIGPGKTPPGKDYISFVSAYIKKVVQENFGFEINVVYGGGLKKENAEMIAGINTIDGGLVALTRFIGEIGFDVIGLKGIVDKYLD